MISHPSSNHQLTQSVCRFFSNETRCHRQPPVFAIETPSLQTPSHRGHLCSASLHRCEQQGSAGEGQGGTWLGVFFWFSMIFLVKNFFFFKIWLIILFSYVFSSLLLIVFFILFPSFLMLESVRGSVGALVRKAFVHFPLAFESNMNSLTRLWTPREWGSLRVSILPGLAFGWWKRSRR